jgi:RND family efflux transporter MFP subunit
MMMTSKRVLALSFAVALAGGGATFFMSPFFGAGDRSAKADAPPPAPLVTVAKPLERKVTDWLTLTGQFAAIDRVEVRARVSGYLTEIHFKDGQIVKKGDLLFVVDPRPYEIGLRQAQAQLQIATAQLELAKKQLDRTSELRQQEFASRETYDQRVQQVRAGEASVEQAKAAINSAQLDLEFSHITAPISGRISARQVSIGNLIQGGSTTAASLLTTIVSLDPLYLEFDMSEADYLAYQRATKNNGTTGAAVEVQARLTDERDWSRKGTLNFVDNQLDRGAGTIRARGIFANPDYFITPGQFARLRLAASAPQTALLVPDASVTTDQSRRLVMTVSNDGKVVGKAVEPGPLVDGLRVIRSGLSASDRIIIDGLMRSRPGSAVTTQDGRIEAQDSKVVSQ